MRMRRCLQMTLRSLTVWRYSLVASAGALLLACQGQHWTEASHETASASPRRLTRDAKLSDDEPEMSEVDASIEQSTRAADEECQPYTDEELDGDGYADDLPAPGPDLSMTFRPEVAGLYVAELRGAADATFDVLLGECEGDLVTPIAGIDGAWPTYTFVATPDQVYTFALELGVEGQNVQLSIELGCEHSDEAYCVRADDEGEPACGMRYVQGEFADGTGCVAMQVEGTVDERCPDTIFRDEEVQGCCTPSGDCGHLDPDLGCHDLAQDDWGPHYCDERAATLPAD
jgi:hypothetical protein